MIAGKAHETVNIDALVLENERLRSNVEYLETHYRRLEAFINGAPFAIAIKNRDRQYAVINPALEQQFGLETDDILWHSDFELVGTPWGALSHEYDDRVLRGQIVESLDTPPKACDGPRHCLVVRFPFVDAEGEALIGTVRIDVSRHLFR